MGLDEAPLLPPCEVGAPIYLHEKYVLTGPSLQYLGMSSSSRQKQKHKSQRKNFGEVGVDSEKESGGGGV